MIDIPLIQWLGFSGNIHRKPKKPSNQPIESQEIVGKRAMLCKESSILKKTWILSQNWFDTLFSIVLLSLAMNDTSNF